MNKFILNYLLILIFVFFSIESSNRVTGKRKFNNMSEEKPADAEIAKMQNLLLRGAKVANFAAVKKALDVPGVNVNATDAENNTALALIAGRTDKSDQDSVRKIVNYLLCRGADINIKNSNDQTPLDIIKNQGLALKNEAFVDVVDRWKNYKNYESAIMPKLQDTNLPKVLCSLVAEYAYESPDQEKQESEERL